MTSIEAKEFELLRQATQVVSKDVTLLDRWYARDQNAMPVVYVLRPVTVKFPCYNDRTEEKRAKRDQVSMKVILRGHRAPFSKVADYLCKRNYLLYS